MVVGSGLGYHWVYGDCIGIRIGLGVMGSGLGLGLGLGLWGRG